MNYASTAKIEEVMKFRNLGDKTFEMDVNCKFDTFNVLATLYLMGLPFTVCNLSHLNLGFSCVGKQMQNLHGTCYVT